MTVDLYTMFVWIMISLDKLRHTRSVAYSVELAVLNKHQISEGGAYLDSYLDYFCFKF